MPPQVSVIIPSHNSGAWIRDCVDSVLRQSYPNIEVIVVDDGSQDSTLEILRGFDGKIRLLQQNHLGSGPARNAGIAQAQGEFIAFLDSDDLWQEDKLRKQVDFMLENPQYSVVYSDADEFDEGGIHARSFFDKFPSLTSDTDIAESMVLRRAIHLTSTIMIRSDFLRQHGLGFHPSAASVQDLYLFLEVYLHSGKFGRLDEKLVKRRLHATNTSGNHYNRFRYRLLVYGDLLQRYRPAGGRVSSLLHAGLTDANFRVGESHWGRLDLQEARPYFQAGSGLTATGIRCFCFWVLTFAPKKVISILKHLKTAYSRS